MAISTWKNNNIPAGLSEATYKVLAMVLYYSNYLQMSVATLILAVLNV